MEASPISHKATGYSDRRTSVGSNLTARCQAGTPVEQRSSQALQSCNTPDD